MSHQAKLRELLSKLKNLLFEHSIKVLGPGETMTLASGKVIGEGDYS